MIDARGDLVRQWLRKASDDLAAAAWLEAGTPPHLPHALFLYQQAAEKALKAFLVSRDAPFTKTHDLADLARLASQHAAELGGYLERLDGLTPYATAYRYPRAGAAEPSAEGAAEAKALATEVHAVVAALVAGAPPPP